MPALRDPGKCRGLLSGEIAEHPDYGRVLSVTSSLSSRQGHVGSVGDQVAARTAAIGVSEAIPHHVAQEDVSQIATAEREDASHEQAGLLDVTETVMVQIGRIAEGLATSTIRSV